MEWILKLNELHDKISGLIQMVSSQKEENHRLGEENASLRDEIARLKEQLDKMETESLQYLTERDQYMSERDTVKERVERLIQLFD
ncbi:MAG: hypothetical protein LBV04_02570 [Deferribacteraceae bacterium]|jgi:regulator of replication initiation timing|nr:hypothetical protein [Deferribacteraceae bacterium]